MNAKKRATVADVARLANVSMMTVSRAINHSPGVSEETRIRILQIAEEIGYRPSQIARGLATRRSTTIGLLVPDVSNPFFAQMARGAEDAAFEQGYSLFLINSAEDHRREQAALDALWQQEIDGAILCSARLSLDALRTYINRFPAVVLVNRDLYLQVSNTDTINVDDRQGARQAVEHLFEIGKRKIAYIAGPETSVSSERRLQGYRSALQMHRLPSESGWVSHCAPTTDGGRVAALDLFQRVPEVDGIFCFNDLTALGVLQACREAGRSVPKRVAVIGADDIQMASLITPRLTTLRTDPHWIGSQAISLLMQRIHEPALAPQALVVQPELILRESA
jgi:LacI family transcriptional regulator